MELINFLKAALLQSAASLSFFVLTTRLRLNSSWHKSLCQARCTHGESFSFPSHFVWHFSRNEVNLIKNPLQSHITYRSEHFVSSVERHKAVFKWKSFNLPQQISKEAKKVLIFNLHRQRIEANEDKTKLQPPKRVLMSFGNEHCRRRRRKELKFPLKCKWKCTLSQNVNSSL